MSRKSERELERDLDNLEEPTNDATYADWWFAGVKSATEDISPEEERLLEEPERHLSPEAWETVAGVIEYFEAMEAEP